MLVPSVTETIIKQQQHGHTSIKRSITLTTLINIPCPPTSPTPRTPRGLEDVSKYPALLEQLLHEGWTEPDVARVAGGNFLRVMKKVEQVECGKVEPGGEGGLVEGGRVEQVGWQGGIAEEGQVGAGV